MSTVPSVSLSQLAAVTLHHIAWLVVPGDHVEDEEGRGRVTPGWALDALCPPLHCEGHTNCDGVRCTRNDVVLSSPDVTLGTNVLVRQALRVVARSSDLRGPGVVILATGPDGVTWGLVARSGRIEGSDCRPMYLPDGVDCAGAVGMFAVQVEALRRS